MAINQILPFGIVSGANVLAPADYQALAARLGGFSAGTAKSKELNTVWRQASFVAAMIGQYIADKAGQDVLDNGDLTALQAKFVAALAASPALTGTPTAPTPVVADNSTKLATTAFVQSVVAGVAAVPATTLVSGISRRATTPEAQGLTSSDTTLSPASLRAAFQGTNYSATFNGFQILPSGIIEQWGVVALVTLPANSTSDAVVTFPMAFTANALSIAVSVETPAPTQVSCSVMTDTLTTTGVTLRRGNSSTSTPWNVVVRYRVIGR